MLEEEQEEQHTQLRDDATMSMFGDNSSNKSTTSYRVLARKYRPQLFSDLIGQEAMVHTLENAFRTRRIAHAFMLTGVRGVGKTTTARLLARGLNYQSDNVKQPSTVLEPMGQHCQAIMDSSHPDVLELDAASRTGVADMRDLLDSVRYSSVSARYKVYIIDEVHMLSIAAFNALLKTLEEPPEHVKFIFATTEIRKVPVTVLSRCQRFDLKRLDIEVLKNHLARIVEKEGASVADDGLSLIARAAEGSVRDALSILDQAIVQAEPGQKVSSETIRDMIGLGDRNRVLDVFEQMVDGDGGAAIKIITEQIVSGADPVVLIKDLLEICADIATVQAIGGTNVAGAENWIARINSLAQKLPASKTALVWQMLLTGYQSVQLAPSTDTAVKMVILRIAVSSKLPSPEQAVKILQNGDKVAVESPSSSVSSSASPPVNDEKVEQKNEEIKQIQANDNTVEKVIEKTEQPNQDNRETKIGESAEDVIETAEQPNQDNKDTKIGEPAEDVVEKTEQPNQDKKHTKVEEPTEDVIEKTEQSIQDSKYTTVDEPTEDEKPHEKTDDGTGGQSSETPLVLNSVDDVVTLMQNAKELTLAGDFKTFMQIKAFEVGKIECSLKPDAPTRLLNKVTDFLNGQTNTNWTVHAVDNSDNNGETVAEREKRKKAKNLEIAKKDPNVLGLLDMFPDAEVKDVRS